MKKENKVLYEIFPTEEIKHDVNGNKVGKEYSQYYEMNPKMCDYFMARSHIGLWSEWHEITTRYKILELRQYENHFVYKFINKNIIMQKFCSLLMSHWWRGMKKTCHVGVTLKNLEEEVGLGAMPQKNTLNSWIERGIEKKILGVTESKFDKRVKLYFPEENLLEFWLMASRNEFLFYQKNGILELATKINKRIDEDENSGLFEFDGVKVWDRLEPNDLTTSVSGKKYTE